MERTRTADARRVIREAMAPGFLGNLGARHGYWLVHRDSGRLLILNLWQDGESRRAASSAEGARRSLLAESAGIRTIAVDHFEVVGIHEEPSVSGPGDCWVRVSWVDGLRPDVHGMLPPLFRSVVPDQLRTRGFRGSYWLADVTAGVGVGISCWDGPAEIRDSERVSRQHRHRLEAILGCRLVEVHEYEAVGVATDGSPPAFNAADTPSLRHLGTEVARPPGSLLAVSGERTDQIVVILGGEAALVRNGHVQPLGPGHHFGGRGIGSRRRHTCSVLATTPVHLQVISRREFHELERMVPAIAGELVAGDASPVASSR